MFRNKYNIFIIILVIIFSNKCFSECCCENTNINKNNNEININKLKNIVNSTFNDSDNADLDKNNDGFIFLNCGYKQNYENDKTASYVDYNCCWIISAILGMLNIPEYQKFIKNYVYDDDEKNLNLKIIKDIYEELKLNIGKYDLDFRKYYKRLYDHGLKYYPKIFEKKTESNMGFPAGNLFAERYIDNIFKNKEGYDYFQINKVFKFMLFTILPPWSVNCKCNEDTFEGVNNVIKDYIVKAIKFYPGHFAFYKIFNDNNHDYYKYELEHSSTTLKYLKVDRNFNDKFSQIYIFIFKDEEVKNEFKKIKEKRFKINSKTKFLNELKNDIAQLEEIKTELDKYNYELNFIYFGPGHKVTVIKDPNSNKFYSLETRNNDSFSKPGELKDFYTIFPQILILPNTKSVAELYVFTVTRK